MNPYEVYTTYLALKRHFSTEQYDYFKYHGKIRCSIESFKKCKDRFFFEKISRKKKPREVIDFFVSNFIASDSPSSLWIGDIIKNGEAIYNDHKRIKESLSYLFEQDVKKLTESEHLYDLVRMDGTKHPKLLKLYLNGTIRFEIFFVFIKCLNIKERYDQALDDPIWKLTSTKIFKYDNFFTGDLTKYKSIVKKYIP